MSLDKFPPPEASVRAGSVPEARRPIYELFICLAGLLITQRDFAGAIFWRMACMPANVLVPLDVERCAVEPLALINRLAGRPGVTVTLLHVVNLNVVTSETRLYRELADGAHRTLTEIHREYLSPALNVRLKVRTGNPLAEIQAEAGELNACLIVLPVFPVARWKRIFAAFTPTVAEKLARSAPCPVFVVRARETVNRSDRWNGGHREPAAGDDGRWDRFLPIPDVA